MLNLYMLEVDILAWPAMMKSSHWHNPQEISMATRKTATETTDPKDTLIESVRTSLDEAEKLLKEAASSTGDKASELREKALNSLKSTRLTLQDAQEEVLARGRKAVRATDEYVHDKPWQAIGAAAVAGFLLGLLTRR